MDEFVIANESSLRLSVFLGMFLLMAVWEGLLPRRERRYPRLRRWPNNLGLVLFNSFLLRLAFPMASVGIAAWVQAEGLGLFNWLGWAPGLEIVLAVLLLDLSIYVQHVAVHLIPVLWRLHRVHHVDPDIDVTTGLRFHPIEILLSMAYKGLIILLLGPSLLAVLIFELLLNGMAMFNHANVRLPFSLDRVIRMLLVTPDFHRVHHSVIKQETNSNYGFNLSIWDRLFRTYRAQPAAGHDKMDIGVQEFRDPAQIINIKGILDLPFRDSS